MNKKKKKIRRENVEDTITQTGNIKGMEMPLKKKLNKIITFQRYPSTKNEQNDKPCI